MGLAAATGGGVTGGAMGALGGGATPSGGAVGGGKMPSGGNETPTGGFAARRPARSI